MDKNPPQRCPLCDGYRGQSWDDFAGHVTTKHTPPAPDETLCPCGFRCASGKPWEERAWEEVIPHLQGQDDLAEHLIVYDTLRRIAQVGA